MPDHDTTGDGVVSLKFSWFMGIYAAVNLADIHSELNVETNNAPD